MAFQKFAAKVVLLLLICSLVVGKGFVLSTPTEITRSGRRSAPFRRQDASKESFFPTATTATTTSTTSLKALSSSTAAKILLRGGSAILDMGRESYKQQSMAGYSTVTALIMNASLRLYTSQKFLKHKETGKTRWIDTIFTALTILCIISGTFTAVLFNILGIYGKESLGLGNEAGYVAFQAATGVYRRWGFRAFLITGITFVGSFLLSVSERTADEDRAGQIVLAISVLLVVLGCFHIKTILNLATKFIYTDEYMPDFYGFDPTKPTSLKV